VRRKNKVRKKDSGLSPVGSVFKLWGEEQEPLKETEYKKPDIGEGRNKNVN
jgi:hypothetical protein